MGKRVNVGGVPPFPPDDEKGDNGFNFEFPTGNESPTDDETRFRYYFGKITSNEEKLKQIGRILLQNNLKVPNKLTVFRKGIIAIPLTNSFIVFDPVLKYVTVLDYIRNDFPIVTNIPPATREKISNIVNEIKKIINK
jgi:hypothetical protein